MSFPREQRGVQDYTYGNADHNLRSEGKSGVPSPVTGSHPSVALKPEVLQPGLLPSVMSLKVQANSGE
jgi:hypothetical protein